MKILRKECKKEKIFDFVNDKLYFSLYHFGLEKMCGNF
jgi:hypothetical protein